MEVALRSEVDASASLEEALPLVASDALVEQPLLVSAVIEVVVDDRVTERRPSHGSLRERRDRIPQRRRTRLTSDS